MQRKQLNEIIKGQIRPNEEVQPEVYELILRLVPRIIEAGVIDKSNGEYRYGSCEVNHSNAIKRIVNNISAPLISHGSYKAGLVDTTRVTLDRQHENISNQVKQLLPSDLDSEGKQKAAMDIADTILTSWLVLDSLPNESGWGDVWISR